MGFIDLMRGNASAASAEKVNEDLQPILVEGERVQVAFKFVRDQIAFTDKRMIFVNKQGMTGHKREWMSIPYNKITRYSAESAGLMDTDAELRLWVGSASEPITLEISRGVSIQALYQTLSWFVLQ